MRELHLGDKTVPAIGLGTWHMGNSTATRAKEIKAIQAGNRDRYRGNVR